MKTKSLVKIMTFAEVNRYIDDHPEWRLPNSEEAMGLDSDNIEWDRFWISDKIGERLALYNKKKQCFIVTHPNFKHNVVLIDRNKKWGE